MDRAALVTLYNATDGASWYAQTNWLSDKPLDEWHGIETDRDGRVTRIDLSGNGLSGAMPPELADLSKLWGLFLSGNDLGAPIPPELGNLSNLERLDLAGVRLTGPIPPELGRLQSLKGMFLDDNYLTGPIPPELGNLSGLERLTFAFNYLSGPVPPELGNLSGLEWLDLGANDLSGQIPSELGSLQYLTALRLGGNDLGGEIPSELGDLSNLTRLELGGNDLEGKLPAELGNLSSLTTLDLGDNELSGEIPSELGDLSSLTVLYLSEGRFSGCVPVALREQGVQWNDLNLLGLPFCDGAQSAAARYSVETRDKEYGYTFELPDGWVKEGEGRYTGQDSGGFLSVRSHGLSGAATLQQFAESVSANLRQEWWPSASLFEITLSRKERIDSREFYSLQYRVQESPTACTLDVQERLYLADSLPGSPDGFRTSIRFCAWELESPSSRQLRKRLQDSFLITTKPASYYNQFIAVEGVTVKASDRVRSVSMYNAADVIEAMMISLREDVRECLIVSGASLAIAPLGEYVTTLPEFAADRGVLDFASGVGPWKGQPVSGVVEDSLLRGSDYIAPTFHEFGHAVQELCFTSDDHEEWNRLYSEAQRDSLFPGAYGMTNPEEFFAEFSVSYFEQPHAIQRRWADDEELTRQRLSTDLPAIFGFLESIYPGFEVDNEQR